MHRFQGEFQHFATEFIEKYYALHFIDLNKQRSVAAHGAGGGTRRIMIVNIINDYYDCLGRVLYRPP